jgi:hypothetical protein
VITQRGYTWLHSVVAELGSMGSRAPPCGGADVAEFVVLLACPPGRSRLLRAAWRPCSRGPARRALVVTTSRPAPLATSALTSVRIGVARGVGSGCRASEDVGASWTAQATEAENWTAWRVLTAPLSQTFTLQTRTSPG